jgi:hypothetical protein
MNHEDPAGEEGETVSVKRVRLWRWRRNALRRPSHVIEGWIILALAVAGLVTAPLVGAVAGKAVLKARSQQRVEHRLTDAVLVENAAPVARGSTRARATVRWTGPQGAMHTGRLQVRGGMERGAHVSVWTDKDGAMTSAPLSPAAARLNAAAAALVATVSVGCAVLAVHRLVRREFDRRRSAQWGLEWARVAQEWDHRNV